MSTYFSASRPRSYLTFFWMHPRATYKHLQNTFPQNVGSDCTFVYIDGLMQSVLYRKSKHNASQWLRRLQPYHKSKHCHIVFCLKILVGNVGYPFFAGVYPTLLKCQAMPNQNTLLTYILPYNSAKFDKLLVHYWSMLSMMTLVRCFRS